MEAQHELAFRTLQSGLSIGKVVVHVARRASVVGAHFVTGGTGGLGLLTGRWLAQRGASSLFLASRSGSLAGGTEGEWTTLFETQTATSLERCDAGEAAHVRRLAARALPLAGVWHAAGVLADGVLPNQEALALACVYAAKAHGAWRSHAVAAVASVGAFALFSSVAALFGGAGQANYAAANACLDALASCRRAHGDAAASVQWGAWAEIGMAARGAASERMAAMEAASGFGRIGLAQGLGALGIAVRSAAPSVLGVVVMWPHTSSPLATSRTRLKAVLRVSLPGFSA